MEAQRLRCQRLNNAICFRASVLPHSHASVLVLACTAVSTVILRIETRSQNPGQVASIPTAVGRDASQNQATSSGRFTSSAPQGHDLRPSLRSRLDFAGSNARAGGHAACSTSPFQGALEMTGRSIGFEIACRLEPRMCVDRAVRFYAHARTRHHAHTPSRERCPTISRSRPIS